MGMTSMVGGNMMMGIQMFLDARRVVSGAKDAEQAIQRIQLTARNAGTSVNQFSRNLSTTLQNMGVGLTMVGYAAKAAGEAIIGGFIAPAYKEAVRYEDALANMRTVLRFTQEEMIGVRKTIEENAMGGMYDFTDVALAATRLAAFTGEAGKLNEQLPTLMKFMTTVGKDLDPEMAARTMSGFYGKWRATGITFEQMGDQLIKLANVTALEFRDLPQILRSSRDIAASLNIKFEEFGALVGVLREGLSPAEAARSASGFARAINTATGAMQEYAKKKQVSFEQAMVLGKTDLKAKQIVQAISTLGVQFFTSTGKAKQFTTVIEETLAAASALKKKGDMREYQRVMLRVFRDQAKNVMSSLALYERGGKSAAEGYKALAKELANSEGYLTWAAKVMGEAPGNIEKKWAASVNRFRASFGKPLMEIFIPILEKLSDLIDQFTVFAAEHPMLAKAIGVVVTALGGFLFVGGLLILALGGIALWLSFIIPAFTATGVAAGVAAAGTTTFGTSLWTILGPIARFAFLIGIAVAGYNIFQKAIGGTGSLAKIANAFRKLGLVFQGLFEFGGGKETKGSRSLYRKLKKEGILGMVETLIQLKVILGEVLTGVLEPFKMVLGAIGMAITAILYPIQLLIQGIGAILNIGGSDTLDKRLSFWRTFGKVIGAFVVPAVVSLAWQWLKVGAAAIKAGVCAIIGLGPIGWLIGAVAILAAMLSQESTWDAFFEIGARIGIFFNNLISNLMDTVARFALWLQNSLGLLSDEQYKSILENRPKIQEIGYTPVEIQLFKKGMAGASVGDAFQEVYAKRAAWEYEKENNFKIRAPGKYGSKSLPAYRERPGPYLEGQAPGIPWTRPGPWTKEAQKIGFEKPVVINYNTHVDARGSIGLDGKKAEEALGKAVRKQIEKDVHVKHGSGK